MSLENYAKSNALVLEYLHDEAASRCVQKDKVTVAAVVQEIKPMSSALYRDSSTYTKEACDCTQ